MNISIGRDELNKLLCRQIKNNFMLCKNEKEDLLSLIPRSLKKVEKCFKENNNKYYWKNKILIFNPYHSGQYTMFLYFLSHDALLNGKNLLADKIYFLNKMLNGCDMYHEIKLPKIFFFDHVVGSVLGRASYSNYFIFQQNCTVGANHGIYPTFGEFVWLFANSTVIGNTQIGNNVFVSANTYIKDEVIPDNTIVFGSSPNLILKSKPSEYFHQKSPFIVHQNIQSIKYREHND